MTADLEPTLWRLLVQRTYADDRGGPVDLAPLRAYVCDFVRTAKGRGDAAETVIAGLKRHTEDAVRDLTHADRRYELRYAVFQWCLDEYYGPETRAARPAKGQSRSSAPE